MRRGPYWLVVCAAFAALLIAAPVVAGTFGPVLLLFALFARGIRPGERFFVARLRRPRRRVLRLRAPRLPLVLRRVGRLLAAALAVRPPPARGLTVP